MRIIRVLTLIVVMPVYLPSKALKVLARYIQGYRDYRRFKSRYRGKPIPLTGLQVYRWQTYSQYSHPFYRPIWYILCKAMRSNPEQLQGYYLACLLRDTDALTPDNWRTKLAR